jgi:hypothetical protein
MSCTADGKSGYKWGNSGKCYTGPDAKTKAALQGRAIEANKALEAKKAMEAMEEKQGAPFASVLKAIVTILESVGVMEEVRVSAEKRRDTFLKDHKGDLIPNNADRKEVEASLQSIFDVKKTILDRGLVYGIVYEPYVVDAHGDWTTSEEIEKAAHDFLPRAVMSVEHKDGSELDDVVVVESYIAPCDFYVEGDKDAFVTKGCWVLVTKVYGAELKKDLEDGIRMGYSLEGTARKVEMEAGASDS